MARSYNPTALVDLPRLRAGGLVALARALLAATLDPATVLRLSLPPETQAFLNELETAQAALQAALGPSTIMVENPETRQADRREDNAIIALREFLGVRARLEDDKAKEAKALLDRLFGQDLRPVTSLPYDEEWAAIEAKLNLIETDATLADGERLRERLMALGSADFLTHLHAVHADYGRALGITTVRSGAESPLVQEKKRALEELIREYVLHLSSYTTRHAPAERKALAETLLKPYIEAKASPPRAASSKPTSPDTGKPDPNKGVP